MGRATPCAPLLAKQDGAQRTDAPYQLTARYFVIATGSSVAPSPLPQLDEVGFITSDDAVALKKLPKSLIILGGGAIACEFAQFFARFGVKVTLLQRSEHILKEFDADAGIEIETVFRREDIQIFTGVKLTDAKRTGKLKTVSFEQDGRKKSVAAEEILFALGRVANTAALNLKKAGVKTDNGRIITNARMQTSAPHIFAAGDCTGPHDIVHIAVTQGEIAAHNMIKPKKPRRLDYRLLLSVVFTDPQVASVGLTEKAAKARGTKFLTASYPFNDHGKSLLMGAEYGFVKLLAHPKSGEILGGACVGPDGGELIHEIVAAMAKRMTVHELAAMPHYHPTLAEIWTYPAEELAEKNSYCPLIFGHDRKFHQLAISFEMTKQNPNPNGGCRDENNPLPPMQAMMTNEVVAFDRFCRTATRTEAPAPESSRKQAVF